MDPAELNRTFADLIRQRRKNPLRLNKRHPQWYYMFPTYLKVTKSVDEMIKRDRFCHGAPFAEMLESLADPASRKSSRIIWRLDKAKIALRYFGLGLRGPDSELKAVMDTAWQTNFPLSTRRIVVNDEKASKFVEMKVVDSKTGLVRLPWGDQLPSPKKKQPDDQDSHSPEIIMIRKSAQLKQALPDYGAIQSYVREDKDFKLDDAWDRGRYNFRKAILESYENLIIDLVIDTIGLPIQGKKRQAMLEQNSTSEQDKDTT